MHLVSRSSQHVRIPGADLETAFERGESIWTESSYKYRIERIPWLLQPAGFVAVCQWIEHSFALTLAEVR
jgi:uncharacterized SAM-dependent methyltransferase